MTGGNVVPREGDQGRSALRHGGTSSLIYCRRQRDQTSEWSCLKNHPPRHRSSRLISIGLIAFVAVAATANAQLIHTYKLVDLGVLPGKKANMSVPAAINDMGQVAGTSGAASVDESAFLYDPHRNREALV